MILQGGNICGDMVLAHYPRLVYSYYRKELGNLQHSRLRIQAIGEKWVLPDT